MTSGGYTEEQAWALQKPSDKSPEWLEGYDAGFEAGCLAGQSEARAQGRQEGFVECREMAAETATAHKGSAAKHRRSKGFKLGHLEPDMQAEIQAEERGEDIASDAIAREIRALQPTDGSESDG